MQRYYILRFSRTFALLYSLFSVLALVSLWQLPLPLLAALVVSIAVLCGVGYRLLRDAALRLHHSCVAFNLEEGREIVLVLRNGKQLPGRISPDSLVARNLVILNIELTEQRGRRSLILLPDAMGAESFRRLRVALRWAD